MKTLYAINPKTLDRWPIFLRSNCDRTPFNPVTGQDESLYDITERLSEHGYKVVNREELESIINQSKKEGE